MTGGDFLVFFALKTAFLADMHGQGSRWTWMHENRVKRFL
ncbi:hypothetical protein FRUB_01487 [Fimbriiglobus ruber]|uniref:Uncharacterized protein n=1 Tax=Fimbriiglobus ruber TaxID=1908690 RepID=A0A225E4Y2_9BACT|nr:hypothetical protein FRUB_01487 [Fimbriiglobus ruber]